MVVVQTSTPNSITFAWAAVAGATAYEVSSRQWFNMDQAQQTDQPEQVTLLLGLKPDQSVTIVG